MIPTPLATVLQVCDLSVIYGKLMCEMNDRRSLMRAKKEFFLLVRLLPYGTAVQL